VKAVRRGMEDWRRRIWVVVGVVDAIFGGFNYFRRDFTKGWILVSG